MLVIKEKFGGRIDSVGSDTHVHNIFENYGQITFELADGLGNN